MAGLIPIGEVEAAGDITTAALVRKPASSTQKAVDGRIAGQVGPLVASAIADDGTIILAAEEAVSTAVAGAGFVTGENRTIRVDLVVPTDAGGPFPATFTANFPPPHIVPSAAEVPRLDGAGRVDQSVLPANVPVVDEVTGKLPASILPANVPVVDEVTGKLPASILPDAVDAPDALWNIADAVNPVPPRLVPDEWSAPMGVLCDTPTYDGSGQTVHPSVMYFPKRLWGYRWWMAVTGYQNRTPAHEDPMVLVSDDGVSWVPAPGAPFPLDDKGAIPNPEDPTRPLDGFNSDTSLIWDEAEGEMTVTWRWFAPDNSGVVIRARSTKDGVNFTPVVDLTDPVDKLPWYVSSQEFVKMPDGSWRMYSVDVQRADPIKYRTAPALNGPWSAPVTVALNTPGAPSAAPWANNPWHIEVRRCGQWYYAVIATQVHPSNYGGAIYLATSRDMETWEVGANPLVPMSSSEYDYNYRASLVPYSRHGAWHWRLYYGGWPLSPARSWTYMTELERSS